MGGVREKTTEGERERVGKRDGERERADVGRKDVFEEKFLLEKV